MGVFGRMGVVFHSSLGKTRCSRGRTPIDRHTEKPDSTARAISRSLALRVTSTSLEAQKTEVLRPFVHLPQSKTIGENFPSVAFRYRSPTPNLSGILRVDGSNPAREPTHPDRAPAIHGEARGARAPQAAVRPRVWRSADPLPRSALRTNQKA